jgi:hypothetical protein
MIVTDAPSMIVTGAPTMIVTVAPSMIVTDAPSGQTTSAPSATPTALICNDGEVMANGTCYDCPAGSYWNGGKCKNCHPGSYSNGFGAMECTKCEIGKYIDVAGATLCVECLSADKEGARKCKDEEVAENRTYECGTNDTSFTADGTSASGDSMNFSTTVDDSMPVFEMKYRPSGFVNELGMKIRLGAVFEYTDNGEHDGFQVDEDTIESQLEVSWNAFSMYSYDYTGYGYGYGAWIQSTDGKVWVSQSVYNNPVSFENGTTFGTSNMYISLYVNDYPYVAENSYLAVAITVMDAASFDAELSSTSNQAARITSSNSDLPGYQALVEWNSYASDGDESNFYNNTVTVDVGANTVYMAIDSQDHLATAYWGASIGVNQTGTAADDSSSSEDSGIVLFDSATSAALSAIVAILIRMLLFV